MKWTLLVIFCAILFSLPGLSQDCTLQRPLVSVSGTAEINVAPDEVILSLGVQTREKDLATAKTQHDSRAKRIIADARDAGIGPKEIQTSNLQMRATFSEKKVLDLQAYEVSQTIVVTLKDLTKYEVLMTKLLQDGVNRVNYVSFLVADDRKYKDEARSNAIRAAKEKATALASELGQRIGKAWQISEDSAGATYLGANANSYASARIEGQEESTVAPGEVTIRASVNVSFELQ